jgi:hypothetical protein
MVGVSEPATPTVEDPVVSAVEPDGDTEAQDPEPQEH